MAEKEYVGSIRKCPNCGNSIESFQAKCTLCGLELSNITINENILEFAQKLFDLKIMNDGYIRFETNVFNKSGQLVGKIKSKFSDTLEEIEKNRIFSSTYDHEAKELILNYPIPNSREDLLEFFIYGISFIVKEPEIEQQYYWNKIWELKLKNIFTKARIAISSEPEILDYMKQLASESGITM